MLLYINDWILVDNQLFIHTIDQETISVIVTMITLPFVPTIFPYRAPPHCVDDNCDNCDRVVNNKSLYFSNIYFSNTSFPCINVVNVLLLHYIYSMYVPLQSSPMLVLTIMTLLTSLACVYCGTHYLSDTLVGYMVGTAVLYCVGFLIN